MAAQFQIQNLTAWLEAIETAKKRASDLTDPLHRIGRDWMRSNVPFFRQKSGGIFEDLSNRGSTVRVRGFGPAKTGEKTAQIGGYKLQKLRRWGFIYPILRASGRLERSMTVPGDPNSLFEILNRETLILGTRAVSDQGANYPAFLNEGTKFMPARPFLTVSEPLQYRMTQILKDFIGDAWGEPGRAPEATAQASKVGSPFSGAAAGGDSGEGEAAMGSSGGGGGGGGGGAKKKKKKKAA